MRLVGFSMFASYGEVCETFGGRSYNCTTRCEGAQMTLSVLEASHGDACRAKPSRRIGNDRFLANVILSPLHGPLVMTKGEEPF